MDNLIRLPTYSQPNSNYCSLRFLLYHKPKGGVRFHSDRGVQYACYEFRNMLSANKLVRQSMSRKANCWDNAVAESFFKTLKMELVYQVETKSMESTKRDIFEFIEIWRQPRCIIDREYMPLWDI